jgi:hypothetical protein
MPDQDRSALASTSLASHLAWGAIGFGLIGSAFALTARVGPVALLFALPGLVALRGCPTCWIVGLIETVSAGRAQRHCSEDSCVLRLSAPGSRLRSHMDETPKRQNPN